MEPQSSELLANPNVGVEMNSNTGAKNTSRWIFLVNFAN